MDEFDYSVHISEQDWRSFFQECEECDLLPPRLARLDDSGMSDMDEVGSQRAWPVAKSRIPEVELQIDGPPDCEGSPVELYLSQYGLRGPERVLSGSEEDLHSETINVFFERLNSFSGNEDGVRQKHQRSVGGEMAGHLEQLADKADATATAGPEEAGRTEGGRRKKTNEEHPCIFTSPEPQLVTNKEDWSQEPVIDGKKLRKCDDVNQVICLKSDGEKAQSYALVCGSVDLANPNQLNGNSQLVANCSCDVKELEADEGQVSSFTPRRKRRRRKRVSSQPVQPDHESPLLDTHGESEDDSYVPRCEVVKQTCTPGDCNSGSVSEVLHTLSPKTDIVSSVLLETHLLPGDADIMEPTVISPNFKKADQEPLKSPSASVTDNPGPDVMPARDVLPGDAAEGWGLALRGESPPPECDVCTQAQEHMALQSDDSTPPPTNGDRVENHLQLNSHMPSQKASETFPVFASVCDTEKAAFVENVSLHDREVTEDIYSNHTAIALTTHANTTALQQPTHLPSDDAVCTPDSPHSPAGEIPTVSDPQANYSGTTYQREKSKATISCVTFPEITEERACSSNAEKEEGCMSHDKVTPELRHGHDSLSQESLSGTYDSDSKSYTKLKSDSLNMVKVQMNHPSAEMNAFDMQMTSDSLNPSSSDEIQKFFSSESKEEMKHLEPEKGVILNKSVNGRLPLNSQNKDYTEEVCPFLKTKDITDVPGSKEEQNMIEAERLSPPTKATNEELPIKEQTRECPSPINTADRECPSTINTADRECPSPINTADRECPSPINTADRECPSPINTADRECPSPINTADRECPSPINTADRECPSPINTADRECPSPINTADRECPSPINTADRECPSPINTADRECPSPINTADRECPSPINTADRECPSPINTADREYPSPINTADRECPSPINTADRECPSPINTADRECPSPINTADRECPSPINTADRECPSLINTADRKCLSPINTADRECPSPINTADRECPSPINTADRECPSPINTADRECPSPINTADRECPSLINTADPMKELLHVDPNPSIIITTSDEEKDQMHYANMPPPFPLQEHGSTSAVMQVSTYPSSESTSGVGDPETASPATTNQPTPPLYAISSFWNEMEKLTINDILRLRLVGQSQHSGVLLQPEDSSMADASDAADSGYFTPLDDSKPDRSSGDMSFMSDFDEEFAQLQASDSAKLGEGSRESPYSGDVMWESQLDVSGTASGVEDVFVLSSESALPPPLYRDSAQQCFRKMYKNVSVQNLQTYEAQPLRKLLRNASLHSLRSVYSAHATHSEEEHDYEDPFNRVDTPPSPVVLSDEEEDLESPGITFSEIIQYLFGTDEPDRCASVADNVADNITPSYLEGTGTSVPETYDHFFSEFEAESFFYPLTASGNDEFVPIFTCARSATKTHHFPEVYDYFFPDDSPVHSDEDDTTTARKATWVDNMANESHSTSAGSDPYTNFFPESSYSWNLLWKNPLSLRRARRASCTEPPEESSSWALTPVSKTGRAFDGRIQPITTMGLGDRTFPDPLLLGLERSIFTQLAQQQQICNEMQTAVADPRADASLMPLKQADMCLVCIAFASWVLKSVNPQGADTWKAALLANVSALSAIRCLRKYMRDEANRKPPLRQIEPA